MKSNRFYVLKLFQEFLSTNSKETSCRHSLGVPASPSYRLSQNQQPNATANTTILDTNEQQPDEMEFESVRIIADKAPSYSDLYNSMCLLPNVSESNSQQITQTIEISGQMKNNNSTERDNCSNRMKSNSIETQQSRLDEAIMDFLLSEDEDPNYAHNRNEQPSPTTATPSTTTTSMQSLLPSDGEPTSFNFTSNSIFNEKRHDSYTAFTAVQMRSANAFDISLHEIEHLQSQLHIGYEEWKDSDDSLRETHLTKDFTSPYVPEWL